jgi:pimeloyl-ACP methyl ester carboxylesterase
MRPLLLLWLLLAVTVETKAFSSPTLEYEVYSKPTEHFDTAQFRMWIPDGHPKLTGILVLIPGTNGYALQLSDDAIWQKIASDWNFALLTIYFSGSTSIGSDYCSSAESSDALLKAIRYFSKESSHPELAECPLAMIGHSAGGQFNYHFAVRHPERVLAFVTIKGGYYFLNTTLQSREVPGLWFAGEKDLGYRKKNIKALFTSNRLQNAPWCYALDPGAGHEIGQTLQLVLPYIHGMIGQRLDLAGKLVPVNQSRGFLGDFTTKKAMPFAEYKGDPKQAAWLPDAVSAYIWEALVSGKLTQVPTGPTLETSFQPQYATVNPSEVDMGNVLVGKPTSVHKITVSRLPSDPPWDEVFCPDILDHLKITPQKIDLNTWAFDVQFDPSHLPMGPFRQILHIRLKHNGRIVLGGYNIPVIGRVTGGVSVTPQTLYLGLLDANKTKILNLDFKSSDGSALQFISVSTSGPHPELVQIKPIAAKAGHMAFTCVFMAKADAGNFSGELLFKLKGKQIYAVLVPFIVQVMDAKAD